MTRTISIPGAVRATSANSSAGGVRTMLSGKIHRATVTGSELAYIGSITLDPQLMAAADVFANEQVQVLNISTGARFETYAIAGGPGEVTINGAAAHLASVGDLVIVASYQQMDSATARRHEPRVVLVDEKNEIVQTSPMPVA